MNAAGAVTPDVPATLPRIPGGWALREFEIAGRRLRLTLPADPDAFLEDPQVLQEHERDGFMPYWPYLWPAAVEMSKVVAAHGWPAGARALEIGAGVGLVGLAAAATGLRVTFSDYRQLAVDLAVHNARHNGLEAEGMYLDWRDPPPVQGRFPVILGCDVVYELANHGPILELLRRMLAEGGVCWIGDAGRQHGGTFVDRARRAGWMVELRNAAGRPLANPQVGDFQLFILEAARNRKRGTAREAGPRSG